MGGHEHIKFTSPEVSARQQHYRMSRQHAQPKATSCCAAGTAAGRLRARGCTGDPTLWPSPSTHEPGCGHRPRWGAARS